MIRRGGPPDLPFLRSLLTHAYNWHVTVFETELPISRYVDGWGRPGDTALLWIERGHRVGAVWYRLFPAEAPGFGFVDEETPELTAVVVPSRQGQGIGLELLRALLERARADGFPGVSVSVRKRDRELGIYEAEGFEPHQEDEHAVTLIRRF